MAALEERTKLQRLLGAEGITQKRFAEVIGAKTDKTVRLKLEKKIAFKLPEMKAVQDNLFPEYSLEEIFEGYENLIKAD